MQRAELLVTGVVQGVGFRPFCARAALSLGLRGTARNTPDGVEIVLEGEEGVIDEYLRMLREESPSAAVVAGVQIRRAPLGRPAFSDFSIAASVRSGANERRVLIPSDLAVCEDCLAEMRDPRNRRYRYPFINCTNCGPRYTIIRALPYDRPATTMADFPMCPDCEREYRDPADRRYHAQPNACPVCGPKIWLADPAGRTLCEGEDALEGLVSALMAGKIAAVKGIGGFHIACLPEEAPLRELRARKHRPDKPFALMTRDIGAARRLADVSPEAERLLSGVQRPIVLCPSRGRPSLVNPGQGRLGLMLPYTPLHHLLIERFEALVMTSANLSDEPIVSTEAEAFSSLSDVADVLLCHNRAIHTAIDDSVLVPGPPVPGPPIFLRRARGYVPNPMSLSREAVPGVFDVPDILAAGAQMKSTYTLTKGRTLFPGQYLGDLEQLGTAACYKKSLAHFIGLYGIEPKILAFDSHPGYSAAGLAHEFAPDAALCPVQHHHAHLASVLLDNGSFEPVIGAIFDGTGYGEDGTIWGGEFLVGDAGEVRRMGSLWPFRLPGGENAIREPWRCALALLDEALGTGERAGTRKAEKPEAVARALWPAFAPRAGAVLSAMGAAPVTTSCGRLFDGFSALLGLCPAASYDGQAAMALENAAKREVVPDSLPFGVEDGEFVRLDWRGAARAVLEAGLPAAEGAALAGAFHCGLARAVAEVCSLLRDRTGIGRAALSGGVWQNAVLLDLTVRELSSRGFAVLTHRRLSPNDEGVSVGQAAAAARRFSIFGVL
ncbi:MAG: carbamoyltransferase HypF [Synergistaceae bacterium]|jgi:hydrogenase maturation protein HypF|nr:carbamoyltransferase HypF [Synergistaceae bacterium]